MKSVVIPFLGIVAIVAFGCGQPQTQTQTRTFTTRVATCTTTDLLNKVHFLQIPFEPRQNSSPQPSNVPVPTNIQNDLQNAFSIAPPVLTARMCLLTYIFIDPTGCADWTNCSLTPAQIVHNSWGQRGWHGGDTTGEYIATSAALWPNGGSVPSISAYENGRLQLLLNALGAPSNWSQITSAAPDTSQMAVLAALAHETGHVYWYDAFIKNRGGHANLNNFCNGTFYTAGAWSHNIDAPPGRWIDFGDFSGNQRYNPDYIDMLHNAFLQNNLPLAASILLQIYQNQDLADLLAAYSPDEDFVEAYQWAVLLGANPPLSSLVSSLVIQIPGFSPYDIAAGNMAKQAGLRRKMNCFF